MHQQGYAFVGPTSFYRLTLPEMRILQAGYQVERQLEEDEAHGVTPSDRTKFQRFENELKTGRFDVDT